MWHVVDALGKKSYVSKRTNSCTIYIGYMYVSREFVFHIVTWVDDGLAEWSTFQVSDECTFEQTPVAHLPATGIVSSINTDSDIVCLIKVFYLTSVIRKRNDCVRKYTR